MMKVCANLQFYGLKKKIFLPIPPHEIDELHYYQDEVPGDGVGLT